MDMANMIIAASTVAGFILAVVTATLGLVVRLTVKWSRLETRVDALREDQVKAEISLIAERDLIREEIRHDRAATNERLTFVERKMMGE